MADIDQQIAGWAISVAIMKKALKCRGKPEAITTDELSSYGPAMDELG